MVAALIFALFVVPPALLVTSQGIDSHQHVSLEPPCPLDWDAAPCECTGHSKAPNIDCSNAESPVQLNHVFLGLGNGLPFVEFTLHKSNLTSLPSNPFATSNFTKFAIAETNVTVIPDDFFKNSANTVKTISITKTQITEFPFKAIGGYQKLEVLILDDNQLTQIESEAFGDTGLPALHDLSLRGNQIKTLGSFAFSNLRFLYKLDISANKLTSLDANVLTLKNHKETLILSVANNAVQNIHKNAFQDLSFSSIHMEFNQLTTLKQDVFEPLLEYLDRTDSSIYTMGNPFSCNLTLEWLVAKSLPVKQHFRDFVCADGKTLETLTTEDLLKAPFHLTTASTTANM